MAVPVVDVRIMRMRVDQLLVTMPVGMWFAGRIVRAVSVLVMLIVVVKMFVFHWFVPVQVFMALGQMQPDPSAHQRGRCAKLDCELVAQEKN